jgi:uncharacterized membrane protein YfcA
MLSGAAFLYSRDRVHESPTGAAASAVPILALLFLLAAAVYASAGFGGGSTYTALLALRDPDPAVVPVVALACNILVVTIGAWRFGRAGHVDLRRIWPLFAASVPMAFVGGALPVPRLVFIGLLSLSLFAAGLLLLRQRQAADLPPRSYPRWLEPLLGGALGLLAGIVGIGGGIYLAPVLHLLRWGGAHAIAGTSAAFILVNSLAGLAGQFAKSGGAMGEVLADHWLLFPAVIAGGLIGSALGARRFDPQLLRVVTAILILVVAAQLGWRFVQLL